MQPRHFDAQGRVISGPPAYVDKALLLAITGIILMGLLMVASSSIVISEKYFHQPFHYLFRQAVFLGLGAILVLFVVRTPIRICKKFSAPLLLLSLVLLILVLIPGIGHVVNGSRRWLGVGVFRMQVSELAKLCLVIYLASYLVRHGESFRTHVMGFIKPMIILGLVSILLLREPDFGAVVVLMLTALGMMFLAGMRVRYFVILLVLIAAVFAVLAISSPYRLLRLTTFLDPWAKQYDSGYQLTQSLIAFGRGGWLGVGLGESVQKLFYLPEAHTDFLFAVLAEELGLAGVLVVIGLFVLLVQRGLVVGHRACQVGEFFAGYLAYGLSLWLGLQAMINIGVNAGVLPTKGLTLPLMSYGGSSILINCIVVALLLRVDYETRARLYGVGKHALGNRSKRRHKKGRH